MTLKRLEELELNLQAKMRSISKERYIEQMERTFQEFCARARQMFEEEFQQILKSEDTNLANQLYLSMKEDLTQLQAARKKLEFGEQLTFDERTLLANLRAYAQFRQGFYTQVVIGELGVSGPQRAGRGRTACACRTICLHRAWRSRAA